MTEGCHVHLGPQIVGECMPDRRPDPLRAAVAIEASFGKPQPCLPRLAEPLQRCLASDPVERPDRRCGTYSNRVEERGCAGVRLGDKRLGFSPQPDRMRVDEQPVVGSDLDIQERHGASDAEVLGDSGHCDAFLLRGTKKKVGSHGALPTNLIYAGIVLTSHMPAP
jgi:hypothetical protein